MEILHKIPLSPQFFLDMSLTVEHSLRVVEPVGPPKCACGSALFPYLNAYMHIVLTIDSSL